MKYILALLLTLWLLSGTPANADAPRHAAVDVKEFSPHREYFLLSHQQQHRTQIFRSSNPRLLLWEIPEFLAIPALSDDGQHVASLQKGANILPPDTRPVDTLLTFYTKGGGKRAVHVEEVIPDLHRLPHTSSGLPWGRMLGFQRSGKLLLVTEDGRSVLLDPRQ